MLFSIVIPVYNKAPYVAKAIQSVLDQTFADYELVIVNDGSWDGSDVIAMRLIEGRDNCCLVSQENTGVSEARNNGAAISQGEYLCFLDADDWWEPIFLEEMSKLVAEFPNAGVYGTNYTIVNETKRKTRVANIGVDKDFVKGYINYCQTYAKTMYMPLWTGAVCIPRRVFEKMQGFQKGIKLGEDFLLWMRIALKYQVAYLNKPLAIYNQDVDVAFRGTNHLVSPEYNFLWHTDVFNDAERFNVDFKLLIDKLRAYDLQPYYLSHTYHDAALKEIKKVDVNNISDSLKRFYARPLMLTRALTFLRKTASMIISRLRNILNELATREWAVGVVGEGLDGIMGGNIQVKWLQHNYKDRWFADPFILDVDDKRIVLLVEEFVYEKNKGRIAKLVVDRDDLHIIDNKTLLEVPTHLSFPAILRSEGKVFVYPENSAVGSLWLYEYKDQKLCFMASICDEPLTDAVITSRFGECRIYATKMPDPNGNTLDVYRSESLMGKYTLHKSIEFDTHDARMAGDFFDYDGVIYKPSQDCNGGYGKAIRLYETREGTMFKLRSVLTSPHPRLKEGMHTLNNYKGITVVDVVGYKHRFAGKVICQLVSFKKKMKQ